MNDISSMALEILMGVTGIKYIFCAETQFGRRSFWNVFLSGTSNDTQLKRCQLDAGIRKIVLYSDCSIMKEPGFSLIENPIILKPN